ncbi:BamA/TamA family outer membrane protein, partial [Flavobacterium sp.]|uniref:translocation and assembly module lipoprotein TamL n=1 Tax=Flavobacterium sp. TaxID=239 RepID=UPI002B4ADE8A
MKIKSLYYTVFILFLASSCSNIKYLPEGESLYVGGKVKVEGKEITKKERKKLKNEFEDLLRPRPNKKILGLRPKLYIYNLAGEPKKEKGIRHWLRNKVGEAPVLYRPMALDYNTKVLQNHAENKGYFNAQTTSESKEKKRKVTAYFTVKPFRQYKIKQVIFPSDSTELEKAVSATKDKSFLKVGEGYDLDKIKADRERIDLYLKEQGYFYFSPDFLKVQIDSTVADHQVDLIVKVKDETPAIAKKVFRINDIIIYPNYSLLTADSLKTSKSITKYKDFTIIDPENLFNPRIFDRTLYFKKNDLYNRTNHNLSLNRLVNLGVFKFVKNQFKVADTTGNYLDAYYYLTPLTKKSIRVEVLAKTNSANYTGTELNVNWSNRNTFKGAELLTISAFGGLEVQMSGLNKGFDVYRVGTEASLIWPRFIAPIKTNPSSGFVPRTKATLGYEYQNRAKLYSLNSVKGSFGYLWKENIRKEHQLNIVDITFVSPTNVTDLYKEQSLQNSTLNKVIEKQLIFGSTYSYTYTNTMETAKRNTIYFKTGFDLAGNVAGLLTGANVKKGDTVTVFKVPFSQFMKVEAEFRHYFKINEKVQIASRVIAGAGYPYGNSYELPFIKQFFIGGTNSIRAFRARSIGPGTYDATTETTAFLPDQSGDLKLEMNTELRAKLFSIVHGALFVDAGNIWLMNKNDDKAGSQFSGKFMNELAVGTGAGLRFDFSFLILRTDLAFPIRKPYLPDGQRWVLDQVNFG